MIYPRERPLAYLVMEKIGAAVVVEWEVVWCKLSKMRDVGVGRQGGLILT